MVSDHWSLLGLIELTALHLLHLQSHIWGSCCPGGSIFLGVGTIPMRHICIIRMPYFHYIFLQAIMSQTDWPLKAQLVTIRTERMNLLDRQCNDTNTNFQKRRWFCWSHARTSSGLRFPIWRLINSVDPLREAEKSHFMGAQAGFVLTYWPTRVTRADGHCLEECAQAMCVKNIYFCKRTAVDTLSNVFEDWRTRVTDRGW